MEKITTKHIYNIDIEKLKKKLGIRVGERIINLELIDYELVNIVTEEKFYSKGEITLTEEK